MWEASKYGVISGPYFTVCRLNTEKYGLEITSYLETFYAVIVVFKNILRMLHGLCHALPILTLYDIICR